MPTNLFMQMPPGQGLIHCFLAGASRNTRPLRLNHRAKLTMLIISAHFSYLSQGSTALVAHRKRYLKQRSCSLFPKQSKCSRVWEATLSNAGAWESGFLDLLPMLLCNLKVLSSLKSCTDLIMPVQRMQLYQ